MTDELISKTDVVKIVKSVLSPASSLTNVARARRQMLDQIYELESKPEPHWIPVTERLPEDNVYVLLTIRRMDDSYNHVQFISTGYISWNHQCWWCAHDGNCKDANVEVLAWMPLSEPYKGVSE